MNINSSSYYSVGGSTQSSGNSGISGLMSGMDTEAMVEKMLSGTQGKIDKQEAAKQQTLWKQEIYRDVISTVNSFRNKYFNTTFGASSKNNFASAAFFNAMKSAVKSGDALKVSSTTSDASVGDIRVKVKQLASNSVMTSDVHPSSNKIVGAGLNETRLDEQLNRRLELKIGSSTMELDLNSVTSQSELVERLNNAFGHSTGFEGVTASVEKGVLRLKTNDPTKTIEVGDKSTSAALSLTGMAKNTNTEIKDSSGAVIGNQLGGDIGINLNTGFTFDLTLDGVQKTIQLNNVAADANGKITVDSFKTALKSEVKKAFGDYVSVDIDAENQVIFGVNLKDSNGNLESGHELIVTGMDALELGITPGASTRINYSTKLKQLGLGGDQFEFSINGTNFKFDGETTVSKMMNTINSSDAGVRMTYSSLSDTFKLEATSSGEKYGIDIQQKKGNVMGTLFGDTKVAAGSTVSSEKMRTDHISGSKLAADYTTKEATLDIHVNGQNYRFSLPKKSDETKSYSKDEIATEFNKWLGEKFSTTAADGTKTAQIAYDKDTGRLNILSDELSVKFAASTVDASDAEAVAKAKESDLAYAMGFNHVEQSNEVTGDSNLSDVMQFKGMDLTQFKKADGSKANKLSEIAEIGGVAGFSYEDGRLSLTSPVPLELTFNNSQGLAEMFNVKPDANGDYKLILGDGKTKADAVTEGTDAIVNINGVETTRSGNSFTVDGITMELTKVSEKDAKGEFVDTIIATTRDTDTVVEGFKSFVDDYNAMLEKLNGLVDADTTYREFPPLTAAQKKDMSENEIKLWEEKAQKGLLRRDSTIDSFLSEMRLTLYTKPEGSSLALYNIGIDTDDYKDKGKLHIDEAALRAALVSDPESVNALFTNATDGLSGKLLTAMKKAAEPSSGSPGALVELAGIKGTTTEKSNTLYDRIIDINSRISDLKYKYEKERARYWNQFNTMESVLSNYNSQSMWMTQQFSGQ